MRAGLGRRGLPAAALEAHSAGGPPRRGPAKPRFLRIAAAPVRVPHDRVRGATRVSLVRPDLRRFASRVEILRTRRRGLETSHLLVRGTEAADASRSDGGL